MKRFRLVLFGILGILVAIALAYLLRGFVSQVILAPMVYLYQIGSLLYRALPQAIWWGVLVLFLTLIAWKTLVRRRWTYQPQMSLVGESLSRAQSWTRWVERMPQGDYSRWLFARQVADLVVSLIAQRERLSNEQARQAIKTGRVKLPPEILVYLQLGLDAPSFRHYSEYVQRYRYASGASPFDLDPQSIVTFLENEIKNGGLA